jgi:hypothetical protein
MSELAEGARLEIVCAVKSGTEGSNPSLSAINKSEISPESASGPQGLCSGGNVGMTASVKWKKVSPRIN